MPVFFELNIILYFLLRIIQRSEVKCALWHKTRSESNCWFAVLRIEWTNIKNKQKRRKVKKTKAIRNNNNHLGLSLLFFQRYYSMKTTGRSNLTFSSFFSFSSCFLSCSLLVFSTGEYDFHILLSFIAFRWFFSLWWWV